MDEFIYLSILSLVLCSILCITPGLIEVRVRVIDPDSDIFSQLNLTVLGIFIFMLLGGLVTWILRLLWCIRKRNTKEVEIVPKQTWYYFSFIEESIWKGIVYNNQ